MPKVGKSKIKNINKNKKLLILVILILLVGGGLLMFAQSKSDKSNSSSTGQTNTPKKSDQNSTVNLSAPTDEQQNAARDNNQQSTETDASGKKKVTPIITSYTKQEVRAFVGEVNEDGGTCTATYTHGADKITASSTGISDVNHTTCGPMTLTGAVNIPGDWSIVVVYSSSTSYGKSDVKDIKVQ